MGFLSKFFGREAPANPKGGVVFVDSDLAEPTPPVDFEDDPDFAQRLADALEMPHESSEMDGLYRGRMTVSEIGFMHAVNNDEDPDPDDHDLSPAFREWYTNLEQAIDDGEV